MWFSIISLKYYDENQRSNTGTQTGMKTSDSTSVLLVGVTISLVGFLFLLVILGVAVDIVRSITITHSNHTHSRKSFNRYATSYNISRHFMNVSSKMIIPSS